MESFAGFFALGGTAIIPVLTRTSTTLVPINADSNPTYAVYSYDGSAQVLSGQTGSASKRHTFTVTGATNATPIVITATSHGLQNGQVVTIANVGGNTAANGTFKVANKATSTFELTTLADANVAGNGAYTSGGSGNVTALYYISLSLSSATYEASKNYKINVTYQVSSTAMGCAIGFTVV